MLSKTMLLTIHDFNFNTNVRLLGLAERVTLDQWDAPQEARQRSLHETLFHFIAVEEEYLHLCTTGESIWGKCDFADFPDVASLQTKNRANHVKFRPWVEALDDEQLTLMRTYLMPHGVYQKSAVWPLLLHMYFHSAQHRSECAFMLTRYGHSPGFIDFFGYGFPA